MKHICISHIMCMHIATATEEVVYEEIAEPQEQLEQIQQEVRESPTQGLVDPSAEQQPEGKPEA